MPLTVASTKREPVFMPISDMNIGDFSRPVVPGDKPRPGGQAKVSPEPIAETAAALEAEAKATEAALLPMRSYEEQLREIGVTKEQAAAIVDAVMRVGYWSEEISITRSIKARLRTRSSRDRGRALAYVENARPMYDAHYQELMNKHLLAASLESFGEDKFHHPDARLAKAEEIDQAFETRFRYVDSGMSDPALTLLLHRFFKFEAKIRAVMQEGAVENF